MKSSKDRMKRAHGWREREKPVIGREFEIQCEVAQTQLNYLCAEM